MTYTEITCMIDGTARRLLWVSWAYIHLCDSTDDDPAYTLAAQPEKTLKAYEKAHAWRELFTLALQQKMPKQAIAELCERVTGE